MDFLQDEVEARYRWDTAAKFARQQAEYAARMAALHRLMRESWANVLRNPPAIRGGVASALPTPARNRLAQYPPGWQPCTAKQLADALDAGWKPTPPAISSAFQLRTAQQGRY